MNLSIANLGMIISASKAEIFLTGGFVFGAGCVCTTAYQTVKACDIIESANSELDTIENDTKLSDDEKIIRKKTVRKKTNRALVKTYIVPVALGVASVACHLASYKVLSAEKAAAITALAATSAAFDKYRSRVIDKYGAEEDYNLYMGKSTDIVETEITDPKTGKTKKSKTEITTVDPIDSNIYAKVFSYETSSEWVSNRRLNIERLKFYERYWNNQLKSKGYVTYNEVIESLGFDRSVGYYMTEPFIPNGIGWISEDNVPKSLDTPIDTFIKFVPDISYDDEPMDLVYKDSYILRFNCYPIDNYLQAKVKEIKSGH